MAFIPDVEGNFKEIPYESLHIPPEPFARTNNTAVYRGKYNKVDVAVKNSRSFSRKELSHHSGLSHPNIVRFVGAVTKDHRNMIVMEFAMAGSLSDRLRNGEPIPATLAYSWSNDAIAAIDYLHKKDIIHQDIKPANFLVFPIGLKACDFGFARALDNGTTMTSQTGGTMRYMPPERFKNTPIISKRSDIYSLMIVIWEIMTGTRHFDGLTDYELTQQKLVPSPPTSKPDDWSDALKDLAFLCWQEDHCDRPTIIQVRDMFLGITEDEGQIHVVLMANLKTMRMAPGYGHKLLSILTLPNGNFQLVVRVTSYTQFHKRCKLLPIDCSGSGFVARRHQSNQSLRKADLFSQSSQGLLVAKLKKNGTRVLKLNSEGCELQRFYLTYRGNNSREHVSSIASDSFGNIYVMCRQRKSQLLSSKLHTQRAKLFQFGDEVGEPLRDEDNGHAWSCLMYDPEGRFIMQLFTSLGFKVKNASPKLKIHKDHIYVNSWVYKGVIEKYKLQGPHVETLRLTNLRDFTISPSGMIVALTDRKVALYDEHGFLLEDFEHKISAVALVDQYIAINGRHVIVANRVKTKVFKVL